MSRRFYSRRLKLLQKRLGYGSKSLLDAICFKLVALIELWCPATILTLMTFKETYEILFLKCIQSLFAEFCVVDHRVINLGKTKRITPCITCTCTAEGVKNSISFYTSNVIGRMQNVLYKHRSPSMGPDGNERFYTTAELIHHVPIEMQKQKCPFPALDILTLLSSSSFHRTSISARMPFDDYR